MHVCVIGGDDPFFTEAPDSFAFLKFDITAHLQVGWVAKSSSFLGALLHWHSFLDGVFG